ncbi:MAG: ATP synthase F1 subunit delta [Gemmiger sp.]|uniref:ATP synthase F1 subunit delta n=1 Tax=Gemmiger sp. TaxID=2049027 RepID=UPI002E798D38|nr:ATP synthase F1 subunit delta [Gemmiger sp.]MEE0800810.1 ATP synthase F1 subunit delta [Gemmiger sp.]
MTDLAKRYGDSIFDLAAEEHLEERLLNELDCAVRCIFAEPEYLKLLCTPSVPKKERTALLDEAFGGQMHPYTVNFLKILCEQNAIRELSACAREYRTRYNQAFGILEVCAVAAVPLREESRQKLIARLAEKTGKKIDLTVRVDPGVLGGIRLDLAGTRLDGTVSHRLEELRAEISEVVL